MISPTFPKPGPWYIGQILMRNDRDIVLVAALGSLIMDFFDILGTCPMK
jgi:hypothetical protein